MGPYSLAKHDGLVEPGQVRRTETDTGNKSRAGHLGLGQTPQVSSTAGMAVQAETTDE